MNTFTVSELNTLIQTSLQENPMLKSCLVKGTITNFKRHSSGHFYFSLKDEKSSIEVALFKQTAYKKDFIDAIENGLLVTILGSINFYAPWGKLTLICQDILIDKKSPLQIQFENLKKELSALGYFDEDHKKRLPYLPKCIAMITSSSGAVMHDMLNVARLRNLLVQYKLFSVPVQGKSAGKYIAKGIELADKDNSIDLIIIARGGGSMEDLWCFNDRIVVEAIYNAYTPIISAIGHETDYTLSDFTADARGSTPSHAIELSVPTNIELLYKLQEKKQYLDQKILKSVKYEKQNLNQLFTSNIIYPLLQLTKQQNQILLTFLNKMNASFNNKIKLEEKAIALYQQRLEMLNPLKTLLNGYAKIEINGHPLRKIADAHLNKNITIHLIDGDIKATVKEINNDIKS